MFRLVSALWLLLVVSQGSALTYAAETMPPIPLHPKSDEDCENWGKQLDAYWEKTVVERARQNDAYCKKTAKEPNKQIVDDPCGNVAAVVTYELCDREKKFRVCGAVQKDRGLRTCREHLATARPSVQTPPPAAAAPNGSADTPACLREADKCDRGMYRNCCPGLDCVIPPGPQQYEGYCLPVK